jgi:zinc protease
LQTKRAQAGDALEVVRKVLGEFLREGPSEDELKAAKANLIGGFALNLDSNKKLITQVSAIGFYGLPLDWLDQYTERLARVKVADVKAAFARHVALDRLSVVTVAAD